jgi:hypothetical protein
MVGKGMPNPLTWQVTEPEYRNRWTHFIHDGMIELLDD